MDEQSLSKLSFIKFTFENATDKKCDGKFNKLTNSLIDGLANLLN